MLGLLEGLKMDGFCDYLEKISAKCIPCVENKVGACHIKLGLQEYYPEYFQLYDTIHIIRHDTRVTVETHIEVKYKTAFPGRKFTADFTDEYITNEHKVKEYLEPRLPHGARLLSLHQHYHPEVAGIEDTVAIHVHTHKLVEDLNEAKNIAQKLAEIIRPSEIEAVITQER